MAYFVITGKNSELPLDRLYLDSRKSVFCITSFWFHVWFQVLDVCIMKPITTRPCVIITCIYNEGKEMILSLYLLWPFWVVSVIELLLDLIFFFFFYIGWDDTSVWTIILSDWRSKYIMKVHKAVLCSTNVKIMRRIIMKIINHNHRHSSLVVLDFSVEF